eukprot:TRINITY_DN1255_c0_g1_i2.p1 TRINITY_DN1255_c0_g1~~TRINITY_DN1255_c0_g1_i2.p1  ORF type:complete len:825 (-),score=179.32 TRINITY_DN1255_c0_g1_i2:277-2751(-)
MDRNMRIWTILSADTGKSFVVQIPNESTVETMQAALAEVSGIPVAGQVLINESGINVRRGMRLTSPRHESAIFVFDLKAITSSELVRRGSVDLPSLSEPPKLASDNSSQHDDGEKEGLLAKALESRADEICELTNKNVAEQVVMARALLSARSNLVGHAAHFCKKFTAFNEELTNSFKQYDKILASCDTGFEALEKVTMPPELLSEGSQMMASMSESTIVQNMQSIRSYVAGALQQLKGRFSELSVTNMETSARLEVHMDMSELEPTNGTHFTKIEETAAEMAELQTAQHELCADPENLSAMYGNDAKLQKKMRKVFSAQESLQQEAHTRMRHVSTHQSQIQKMAKSISGYKDSLQSLDRYFGELEHVPHISTAFEAGLIEVRRRAQFREAYSHQANQCTEMINELVQCEIGVRKAFANTHGRHLPPTLIPGLSEMPPTLNIEVPLFDTELPTLEAEEASAGEPGAPAEGEGAEGAEGEGAASAEEAGAPSEGADRHTVAELKKTLETVRRERDSSQQSMLEAHLKVSSQESQIKSMDEVRMNNTNLEVQLGQLKQTVSQLMESLEGRNSTLAEIKQLLGMASSVNSDAASGSSFSNDETSTTESQHDLALLEILKSQLGPQKSAGSEVERLEQENAELKAQLQSKTEHVSLNGDFQVNDLMCFLRRRPSQLTGCTQSEIYEAITTQGDHNWFLDPCPEGLSSEDGERPRVIIGRMADQELIEPASAEDSNEGTPAEGSNEGTPAEGSNEGTPAEGSNEGTPAEGSNEGTLAEGSNEGTPAEGSSEGTPAKDSNEGTPAEGTRFGLPKGSGYHCVRLADMQTFT